jgi:ribosomal protein L37AE/L43A
MTAIELVDLQNSSADLVFSLKMDVPKVYETISISTSEVAEIFCHHCKHAPNFTREDAFSIWICPFGRRTRAGALDHTTSGTDIATEQPKPSTASRQPFTGVNLDAEYAHFEPLWTADGNAGLSSPLSTKQSIDARVRQAKSISILMAA